MAASNTRTLEEKLLLAENSLTPGIQSGATTVTGMNILERMKHHNVPGVSIAIVDSGKTVSTRTYGEMESKSSVNAKLTADTLFQAGSISKFLTAVIALNLVEKGILNLDEDVNNKLTSFKIPPTAFTREKKITLRHLLSHTAGLNVHGFDGYPSTSEEKDLPTLVQVLKGIKPANSDPVKSEAIPGETCRYSGGGTEVIQLLLEDVTGKKFSELAKEIIFAPLGMKCAFSLIWPSAPSCSIAVGHDHNGAPIKGGWHLFPESAAAGLWAKPSDLARFVIEIQNILNGVKSNGILSRAMAIKMLTLQEKSAYGLGPVIGVDEFSHAGGTEGYEAYMVGFSSGKDQPGSGQGVVIMTNSANGTKLIPEIVRSVAKAFNWPETFTFNKIKKPAVIDPSIYRSYEGDYTFELKDSPSIKMKLTFEDNKLFIITPLTLTGAPKKIELIPQSETHFITEGFEINFTGRNEFLIFGGTARRIFPSSTAKITATPPPRDHTSTPLDVSHQPDISSSDIPSVFKDKATEGEADATIEAKKVQGKIQRKS